MSKNIFTPDFYKNVYKAICEYCEKNYESNGEASDTMSGCFTLDEYEIEFDADIECEWCDESFDHAFGTWHDPYAGYGFGCVSGISEINIYGENGLVESVDIDEFEAVFHEAEHKGHKAGDKVNILVNGRWSKDIYELAFYDSRTDMYAVRLDKPVAGCNYRGVMCVRNAA